MNFHTLQSRISPLFLRCSARISLSIYFINYFTFTCHEFYKLVCRRIPPRIPHLSPDFPFSIVFHLFHMTSQELYTGLLYIEEFPRAFSISLAHFTRQFLTTTNKRITFSPFLFLEFISPQSRISPHFLRISDPTSSASLFPVPLLIGFIPPQ